MGMARILVDPYVDPRYRKSNFPNEGVGFKYKNRFMKELRKQKLNPEWGIEAVKDCMTLEEREKFYPNIMPHDHRFGNFEMIVIKW